MHLMLHHSFINKFNNKIELRVPPFIEKWFEKEIKNEIQDRNITYSQTVPSLYTMQITLAIFGSPVPRARQVSL